jgi:preprotein translocase subunit SecB
MADNRECVIGDKQRGGFDQFMFPPIPIAALVMLRACA